MQRKNEDSKLTIVWIALIIISMFSPPAIAAEYACLKRMDFQLTGVSCVMCVKQASWKIRHLPGVLKADVSIYKPHWSVVVYDCAKTSSKRICSSLEKIKMGTRELTESSLDKIPPVILPRAPE